MKLNDIYESVKELDIFEKRYDSEEYYELVFLAKDVDVWVEQLSTHLGPPEKPAGTSPTRDQSQLTEPYGGIRKDQTLFFKGLDDGNILAMFWPWKDNEHITLRMVLIQE